MNFGLLPEGEAEAWIPDGAGGAPVGGQALVHFDVPDAGEAPKLLDDRVGWQQQPTAPNPSGRAWSGTADRDRVCHE